MKWQRKERGKWLGGGKVFFFFVRLVLAFVKIEKLSSSNSQLGFQHSLYLFLFLGSAFSRVHRIDFQCVKEKKIDF